jgi:hypothetical protein
MFTTSPGASRFSKFGASGGLALPPSVVRRPSCATTITCASRTTCTTGDPEQLKQFEDILDRAANGNWYIVRHIERHWNSETNTMMVYVEWLQRYSALPPNVQQGAF